MASKRRLRRRACEGKHKYETREQAMEVALRIRRRPGGSGVTPYRCERCGNWHNGHIPMKVVEAMLQRREAEGY